MVNCCLPIYLETLTILRKVLITGASGFVGRAVCAYLRKMGYAIIPTARTLPVHVSDEEFLITGNIYDYSDWLKLLESVDVVIHLAGRAHVLNDKSINPLSDFRLTNTLSTLKLGSYAKVANIKRFIFVSSIGVNGAETFGKPYKVDDPVMPHSDYALSKYEAEIGLNELFRDTDTELIILRPPLIYAGQAPGNIGLLKKLIDKNCPIPLAKLANKRSFLSLNNFVNAIEKCINHKNAANKTFLISDGVDLSTTEFVKLIAFLSNNDLRLFTVYPSLMQALLKFVGKDQVARSLYGDLQIDTQTTMDLLEWKPVFDPRSVL